MGWVELSLSSFVAFHDECAANAAEHMINAVCGVVRGTPPWETAGRPTSITLPLLEGPRKPKRPPFLSFGTRW
jgi:hypothetical protein